MRSAVDEENEVSGTKTKPDGRNEVREARTAKSPLQVRVHRTRCIGGHVGAYTCASSLPRNQEINYQKLQGALWPGPLQCLQHVAKMRRT
jgi:hypothetical protein